MNPPPTSRNNYEIELKSIDIEFTLPICIFVMHVTNFGNRFYIEIINLVGTKEPSLPLKEPPWAL